jgi:hypothetical protein
MSSCSFHEVTKITGSWKRRYSQQERNVQVIVFLHPPQVLIPCKTWMYIIDGIVQRSSCGLLYDNTRCARLKTPRRKNIRVFICISTPYAYKMLQIYLMLRKLLSDILRDRIGSVKIDLDSDNDIFPLHGSTNVFSYRLNRCKAHEIERLLLFSDAKQRLLQLCMHFP